MSGRVNGRPAIRANGPRGERNERIAARVLEDGATFTEVAREFGLSRERIRQIVARGVAVAAAEQAALERDEAALRLRYACGLELVPSLELADRYALLAAVVWPGDLLAEASLARASTDGSALHLGRRRCRRCGIAYAAGYTSDCPVCAERLRGLRRRARAASTEAVSG